MHFSVVVVLLSAYALTKFHMSTLSHVMSLLVKTISDRLWTREWTRMSRTYEKARGSYSSLLHWLVMVNLSEMECDNLLFHLSTLSTTAG